MAKYRYPVGAIKELDEIRAAITARATLYSVTISDRSTNIPNLAPFTPTKLEGYNEEASPNHTLYLIERETGKMVDISLDWRGIPVTWPESGDFPGGHLFSNYWHAYAYSLRIEGLQDDT